MRKKRIGSLTDSPDDGGINLTPLIDVVFVVLIMFILVAPMLELDKVKLAQGGGNPATEAITPSSLVIHVREDNTILINKHEINPENLIPIFTALHTKDPQLIPQLYHDRKAFFGTYQLVKTAIETAGFEELDVLLEPHQ